MGALVIDLERGIARAAALALALFASACFNPSETDGAVACGEDESCPPGFACLAADQRCYRDPPADDVDGAPAEDDGAAPGEIDAAPGEIDAAPDDPDASVPPDAGEDAGGGNEASEFCERYEDICGFSGSNNRYDDFEACLTAFDSFDPDRKACVEDELELAAEATGGARNAHCSAAAGNAPCD